MSKNLDSEMNLSLQYELDLQKKSNSEYIVLINELENENNNLKNKIKFLESQLNKNISENKDNKDNKDNKELEQNTSFTQKITKWFYF